MQYENKHKDPQVDSVQRGRDLRTAGPKWDESIKFIPPGLRKAHARRIRKILRGRGDGEYQENKTF